MASARSSWYPSGRILYEDNTSKETIPLVGVKVMIKRWFKLWTTVTTNQGFFYSGGFKSKKVKIGIKWERDDWDIRSGSYGQAWYTYESVDRGNTWNKTIRKSGTPLNWLYASVHRGAEEYFSNHRNYGIRKPYSKYFFTRRLHIGVKDKEGRAHYFTFNKIWWAAPVVIYSSNNDGGVQDSRNLFATTVHELAHVSHWEIGYTTGQYVIDALISDPKLPESWAVGVEHTIANAVYPDRGSRYDYPYRFNRQDLNLEAIQKAKGYTPIVIDMIDNHNQSIKGDYPNDRVYGYTLGQLENALPQSFGSWWNWRSRIRSQYDNPTENTELDYLFQNYD